MEKLLAVHEIFAFTEMVVLDDYGMFSEDLRIL